jgi:hypothetical protein
MILGLPLWKLGTAIGIVLTLMGSCALRDHRIETRGAEKAVAKIEKATSNAVKKGSAAADRSGAPGVRGLVDPTTRND